MSETGLIELNYQLIKQLTRIEKLRAVNSNTVLNQSALHCQVTKKSAIFFTSTQACQDQNKDTIQKCSTWFFFSILLLMLQQDAYNDYSP